MADVLPIDGVIRRYAWGSRTAIQQLLGQQPDGQPAAELWFGAHAGDPSPTPEGPLDELIAADPDGLLGEHVVAEFGPRLPFLLKVLAAETPLSIQVHPNLEQARAGFAADDPNYSDANHKPELLCALTAFEALCGFRPIEHTLALLDDLAVPELGFVADHLRGADPLRAAFTALLSHPDPAGLSDAVAARADEHGPLRPAWLAAQHFPGDIGVVLTLLLNPVRLQPGEAIYLGAGNVHCYLRGTGVEIMANSDNVLRCGLTPKRIDVAELLRITDFSELRESRWPMRDGAFTVPVPDFALRPVRSATAVSGPAIVVCAAGRADVGGVGVEPGHAAFVPAGPEVVVVTDGLAFLATPGC